MARRVSRDWLWTFGAGLVAGGASVVLARAFGDRPRLDHRLVRALVRDARVSPTVIVPGILGSSLLRPDGSRVWLDLGNTLGWHDLSLSASSPTTARDALVPGPVVGAGAVLPRLFGFTEYADLFDLLGHAGFRDLEEDARAPLGYLVATYDWRLDLLASVRRLHAVLEELARVRGAADARFNVLTHSMGGVIARYYLRYGTAEPGGAVTWGGARRIRRLILVSPPNGGSIGALDAILNGQRVGLSYGTLAASVVSRMPAIYQLLPPREARPLVDEQGQALDADLLDVASWERLGWGPFAPRGRRKTDSPAAGGTADQLEFVEAALARAREIEQALARPPSTPCPVSVALLGGDCIPTLARAILSGKRGSLPRFEPATASEADAILEAGDSRVTRASALASHLPAARTRRDGCGLPEVEQVFFGAAEHHGIYAEPTFQNLLLRRLLDRGA